MSKTSQNSPQRILQSMIKDEDIDITTEREVMIDLKSKEETFWHNKAMETLSWSICHQVFFLFFQVKEIIMPPTDYHWKISIVYFLISIFNAPLLYHGVKRKNPKILYATNMLQLFRLCLVPFDFGGN